MLTLSSFGIAASLSRHISPYRSCVSLSHISPRLGSSRQKKNSLVLSWQLIWCTAVCSPEQSLVIREYGLQEHMLLRQARQVFWKRPCWFPPALTFPTVYCLVSLCCLRKRAPDFTCLQKPLCCSSLSLHVQDIPCACWTLSLSGTHRRRPSPMPAPSKSEIFPVFGVGLSTSKPMLLSRGNWSQLLLLI